MKNILRFSLLVLLFESILTLPHAQAQNNCNDYLLLNDNAQYELVTYSSKDKLMSRVTYHVKDVSKSGGKIEATVESKVYDNNDKLGSEGEFAVGCENGSIWMDMRSMMNPETMEAYKDMDVSMQGDKMLYPTDLKAGQKLEDGTLTIETKDKSSGQSFSTITMKIVDRTVEGKESIKVPAGSYEAFKIRQNTEMENRAMGIKMPGMRVQNIEYYVPNIGVVRSESYRNGRLMSYSVLNKISK